MSMLHIELTPYRFLCDITTFTSLFDENECGERVPDTAAFQCTWSKVQRNNRSNNTNLASTCGKPFSVVATEVTPKGSLSLTPEIAPFSQHTPPVYFKSAHSDMALTFPAMKYDVTLSKENDVLCFELRPCDFYRRGVSVTETFIHHTSNIDTSTSVVCDQNTINALPQEQRVQLNAVLPVIAKGTLDPSLYCNRPRKNYTIKLRDAGGEVIGRLIFALHVIPEEEYLRSLQEARVKRSTSAIRHAGRRHSSRRSTSHKKRSSSSSLSSSSSSSSETSSNCEENKERLKRQRTAKPNTLSSTQLAASALSHKSAVPTTNEHTVPETYERLDFIVETAVIRDDAINLRNPPPLPIGEEHYLKIRYDTQKIQSTRVICNSPREIDFGKQHSYIDLKPGSVEKIHFALWQDDKQVAGFALDPSKFRLTVNKWKAYAIPFRYLPSQQAATLNVSVRRNEATVQESMAASQHNTSASHPTNCISHTNDSNKKTENVPEPVAIITKSCISPTSMPVTSLQESLPGITSLSTTPNNTNNNNNATTTATTAVTMTTNVTTLPKSKSIVQSEINVVNTVLPKTTTILLNEHKRLAESLHSKTASERERTPLRTRSNNINEPCGNITPIDKPVLSTLRHAAHNKVETSPEDKFRRLSVDSHHSRVSSASAAADGEKDGLSLQTNRLQSHSPLRQEQQQEQQQPQSQPFAPRHLRETALLERQQYKRQAPCYDNSRYHPSESNSNTESNNNGNGNGNNDDVFMNEKWNCKRRDSVSSAVRKINNSTRYDAINGTVNCNLGDDGNGVDERRSNSINNKNDFSSNDPNSRNRKTGILYYRYGDDNNCENVTAPSSHLPLSAHQMPVNVNNNDYLSSNMSNNHNNNNNIKDYHGAEDDTEAYVAEVIARIEAHERQRAPHQRSSLVEEWMSWQNSRASSRAPTPHSWRSSSLVSECSREGSVYSVASSRATSPLPTKSISEFAFQQPYEPFDNFLIRRRSSVNRVVSAPGQRGFRVSTPPTAL